MKNSKVKSIVIIMTFVLIATLFSACGNAISANLNLVELKVGEVVLTAVDGKYQHEVDSTVDKIVLSATAEDQKTTLDGLGEKNLVIGENSFVITASNGNEKRDYSVVITRKAPPLVVSEVKIGDEVIAIGENGKYNYTVGNDVTEVTISATANYEAATISGTGLKAGLVTGENSFDITATMGEERVTCTVVVNRKKNSVNTIESVKVNEQEVQFNSEKNAYCVTLNDSLADVVVALTSEVASYVINPEVGELEEGENNYFITVTAENGQAAVYTLIIDLVLPVYEVNYNSSIEGAVTNEAFEYKHGKAQTINITLDAKYSQSYANLVVTYKVGEGAEKSVTLDESYSFVVPANEAKGNMVINVSGIALNNYTVTYHNGETVTTETVAHGSNAQNNQFDPSTETKEVLDGYTYSHFERWVTEEGGMQVASFENVTENMDVYLRSDEVMIEYKGY